MSLQATSIEPIEGKRRRGNRLTISLPKDVHDDIRKLAKESERSVAAQVRFILRRVSEDPDILEGR